MDFELMKSSEAVSHFRYHLCLHHQGLMIRKDLVLETSVIFN
jgi:hypothetical protein